MDLRRNVLDGISILLVEDCVDNQVIFTAFLQQAGADIELAGNGQLAVERITRCSDDSLSDEFDLIVMDMQMPVMDGYTATRTLRELGYTGRIVALTAHAHSHDEDRCLKAGCDDYATKPIRWDEFLDLVDRNCSTHV